MIPSTDKRFSKDQLIQEQAALNGGYTYTFGYDAADNLTLLRSQPLTYSSNGDNQLSGNSYDGDGNPLNNLGVSLGFDVEDRLSSYSDPSAGYLHFQVGYWEGGSRLRFRTPHAKDGNFLC